MNLRNCHLPRQILKTCRLDLKGQRKFYPFFIFSFLISDVRKCLSVEDPKLDECIDLLQKIDTLPFTQLMLKKQPQVVKSIHKICSYAGTGDKEKTQKIREMANGLMTKVQGCFDVPENTTNFYAFFAEEVKQFLEKTSTWPSEKVTYMTSDVE